MMVMLTDASATFDCFFVFLTCRRRQNNDFIVVFYDRWSGAMGEQFVVGFLNFKRCGHYSSSMVIVVSRRGTRKNWCASALVR